MVKTTKEAIKCLLTSMELKEQGGNHCKGCKYILFCVELVNMIIEWEETYKQEPEEEVKP